MNENINVFNENDCHKHLKFTFYNQDEYDYFKTLSKKYKRKSPMHYETFKRTITFYKLSGEMDSIKDYECNFNEHGYDTVLDTLSKDGFTFTFGFKKSFLNPRLTSRRKFEKELIGYLIRRGRIKHF